MTAFLAAGRPASRQEVIADALTNALADLAITRSEVEYLRSRQSTLRLTDDELRWMHARAFAGILADVCRG